MYNMYLYSFVCLFITYLFLSVHLKSGDLISLVRSISYYIVFMVVSNMLIHVSFSSFLFIPFSSIVWCAQFIPLCDVGQGCLTWLTIGGDTITPSNTHFAKYGLHNILDISGKCPYFSTSKHVFFCLSIFILIPIQLVT